MSSPAPVAIKRSHSPDAAEVLASPEKRTRASEGPGPADAPPASNDFLSASHLPVAAETTPLAQRSHAELVHMCEQLEQLLQDTSYAQQARAILYPTVDVLPTPSVPTVFPTSPGDAPLDMSSTLPLHLPSSSVDMPHVPIVDTHPSPVDAPPPPPPAADSAPTRPYTPSIPAPHEDPPSSSSVSSRIAAILKSIQSTNASGPMLGLQGQPLAPSKQAAGANVSGGLSSLLSSQRVPPANSTLSRLLEQHAPAPLDYSTTPLDTPPTGSPAPVMSTATTAAGTPDPIGYAGALADTRTDDASSREARLPSSLPSYEDMIVEGLQAIGDVNGTPPRMLFHWMEDTYPLMKNFRPSASQALQKAFKRGRLHKAGSLYRINHNWDGSNAGRKPTRRPQIGKDHPMLVNGPKGPAPASPFKARAQYQGAAAYRQATIPLNKQRTMRLSHSVRPGPKPYGQPGAAPLDNPASSIFQNGAAAAALLMAHQERMRGANSSSQDLTPSLTSLVQQLRNSAASGDGPGPSSLSSVLANALLKHARADGAPDASYSSLHSVSAASSPVLQSLSRLLGTARPTGAAPPTAASPGAAPEPRPTDMGLPATGPGSLSASIETLVRQATRAAQESAATEIQSDDAAAAGTRAPAAAGSGGVAPGASQADLDTAVSQTLQAAFQQLGPGEARKDDAPVSGTDGIDTSELNGINLEDYSDALRTLTAALAGTEEEDAGEVAGAAATDDDEEARHLADERAIAEAEADLDDDSGSESPAVEDGGPKRMEALLKSYGIDVSSEALQHLTETLRDPNTSVEGLTSEARESAGSAAPGRVQTEASSDTGEAPDAGGMSTDAPAPQPEAPSGNVPSDADQRHLPAPLHTLDMSGTAAMLDADATHTSGTDAGAAAPGAPNLALPLLDADASDAAKNQNIQSQLEALIASLAADAEST